MNHKQKLAVQELLDGYKMNMSYYSSWSAYGQFHVYGNKTTESNIVVVVTLVENLTDDYQPITSTQNLLIDTDGATFDMATLFSTDETLTYIQSLENINYNE